mmetsp:Transcript_14749/g.32598  ORF Transcript_14749/g.32598 Transcript_14749/m.32598 type:complete len:113 (+) Transcript_14749:308-646(+)
MPPVYSILNHGNALRQALQILHTFLKVKERQLGGDRSFDMSKILGKVQTSKRSSKFRTVWHGFNQDVSSQFHSLDSLRYVLLFLGDPLRASTLPSGSSSLLIMFRTVLKKRG